MFMRRLLIYTILIGFLLCSFSYAVDKTSPKKASPGIKDSTVKIENKATGNKQIKKDDRKDYNDFMDGNNNGIDDRVESRKKVSSADKSEVKKKPEKTSESVKEQQTK